MRALFQLVLMTVALSAGQSPALTDRSPAPGGAPPPTLPPGYVIGVDDHLAISFWREKDLSADVVVRPDGRITLPLLNEIHAAGLTPDQLRGTLLAAAESLVDDPNATVVVTEVHSRRAFITGSVEKPGMYPLNVPMTVLQLIATAGGLREFVGGKNIVIVRREGDRDVRFPFDYQAVVKGRNLRQNIELRPGDTVIVP
jgi:polysaccharide export outer membrane protein